MGQTKHLTEAQKAAQQKEMTKIETRILESELRNIEVNGKVLYSGPDTDAPTQQLTDAVKAFQQATGITNDTLQEGKIVGKKTDMALGDMDLLSSAAQLAKSQGVTVERALDMQDDMGRNPGKEFFENRIKQAAGHEVDFAKFGITGGATVQAHGGSAAAVAGSKPVSKGKDGLQ